MGNGVLANGHAGGGLGMGAGPQMTNTTANMENRDLSADGWCGFKWAFGGIFSAILNVISDAISYFLRARLN